MTEAEREKIISDDFADFIIDYNHYNVIFDSFTDSVINTINQNYSIIHLPVQNMEFNSISKFGYYSIPSCFGLLSNTVEKVDHSSHYSTFLTQDETDMGVKLGAGTLIGFVDTGIEYTHTAFLNEEGKTRIVSIWDQTIQSTDSYPPNLHYGTEYTREQINDAILQSNPYDYVPSKDEIGHGTMIAGFAAGSPNVSNGFTGLAPGAELVIVKLKQAKPYLREFFEIPDNIPCYQETDIIMGVKYLDEVAEKLKRPMIICIGLGTSLTDHEGGRIVSSYLASIASKPLRSVIVAGGNEGNRPNHFYGHNLVANIGEDVLLRVGHEDKGFAMQFWGLSPNYFWIDLYEPGNTLLTRVPPIDKATEQLNFMNTTIVIDVLLDLPNFYEQAIVIRFHNPLPGDWRFRVFGASTDLPMEYHFWLPIHNFLSEGTAFLKPDYYTTLTGPSNNAYVLTTVAYDAEQVAIDIESGKGFTVSNRPKPDIAAPGVNILCPFLDNTYRIGTGSSLSAAFTAGIASRIYEWAIIRENFPTMDHFIMKKVLIQSACRFPEIDYPNQEWGYGFISLDRINTVLDGLISIQCLWNDTKK